MNTDGHGFREALCKHIVTLSREISGGCAKSWAHFCAEAQFTAERHELRQKNVRQKNFSVATVFSAFSASLLQRCQRFVLTRPHAPQSSIFYPQYSIHGCGGVAPVHPWLKCMVSA